METVNLLTIFFSFAVFCHTHSNILEYASEGILKTELKVFPTESRETGHFGRRNTGHKKELHRRTTGVFQIYR